MINIIANEQLKSLGCKWDGTEWIAPKLAMQEAEKIKQKFYSDLIVIEVSINAGYKFLGTDWAYSHIRTIGGYIIAQAKGRDTGSKIQAGIAVISGKFSSGGSVKNFICTHTDDLVLRMEISKNALNLLDSEVSDGLYTYKILSDITESSNELQKYTTEELLAEIKRRG